VEHQLSVIVNPKKRGLSYNKWSSPKDKLTNRDMLRLAIDLALQSKPKTMDELFAILQQSGYEIIKVCINAYFPDSFNTFSVSIFSRAKIALTTAKWICIMNLDSLKTYSLIGGRYVLCS